MSKNKYTINRKSLSSEEIAKGRDFQSVLKGAELIKKPFYKQNWFIANSVIVGVVATVASVLLTNNENTDVETGAKSSNYVNQPFKNIKADVETFNVDVAEGITVYSENGSSIAIPDHAFVYDNNDPVEGEVEIKYKEIHDQKDIFLAGVPMEYDSAGVKNNLKSAGMIHIQGYKDGKKVHIAKGKKLDIELVSQKAGTNYNIYELDTVNKNWVYKEKGTVAVHIPEDNADSEIEETPEIKKIKNELAQIQNDIKILKKNKPVKPQKAGKNDWKFNLEVDDADFPELAAYKNTIWQVDESRKKFDPENAKIIWSDIIIEKDGDNAYEITFTKADLKVSYFASPVFAKEDYAEAKKVYDQKFKEYDTKLQERKKLEAEKKQELEERRQKLIAYQDSVQQIHNAYVKKINTINHIRRGFSIENFGYWNCDDLHLIQNRKNETIFPVDDNGDAIDIYSMSVVLKGVNSVYNVGGYKDKGYYISYNEYEEAMIWTVTKDGKLAVLTYEEFERQVKNSPDSEVEMKIFDIEITSEEQFSILYHNNFDESALAKAQTEKEKTPAATIKTYPNPFKEKLVVETNVDDNYKVEIVSLNGQIKYQSTFSGTELEVTDAQLSAGMYLVRLINQDTNEIVSSSVSKM